MGEPFTRLFGRRSALSGLALLSLAAVLGLLAPRADARQPDQTDPSAPDSGLPAQFQAGEIKLKVEKFGVEANCRAGEWVGVRIQATDTSTKQREVILGVQGFDPDGDTPLIERTLTTNPGVPQSVWLYFRLPYNANATDPFTFTAHEALELPAGDSSASIFPYAPGKLFGRVAVTPRNLVDPYVGLIGIIGKTPSAYGLTDYSLTIPGTPYPPFGHEPIGVVTGIVPEDLPDRWMGLMQFSTLVWGSGQPEDIRGERATALREWVSRGGGHLVIILPAQSWQKWTNPAANELYSLMPIVSIEPHEGVDFEPLRPLLMIKRAKEKPAPLPTKGILLTLTPRDGVKPTEAIPILNGPALPDGTPGQCLVARRLVGTGMVTLIGIDLNQPAANRPMEIAADAFWHRILGHRGQIPTIAETTSMRGLLGGRSDVYLDQDIGSLIAKTGTAAAGILLGFVIFAIYWIIAGPGGFAILKNFKQTKHSWVAYVGAGGVFTAIAWTGATLIRPMSVSATHLTIVDYVSGNDVMRARSWMSVLIPRYGDATIRLGKESEEPTLGADRPDNTIAPWEERRTDLGSAIKFPDSRAYAVDARSHDALRVPARATVKQLEINWAGLPVWKFPMPCTLDGKTPDPASPESRITLVDRSKDDTRLLAGAIKHDLPAPLEDVLIVIVRGQRPVNGTSSSMLPVNADAYMLTGPWPAGEPLDLGQVTQVRRNAAGAREDSSLSGLLDGAGARFSLAGNQNTMQLVAQQQSTRLDSTQRLTMLGLMGMLGAPDKPDLNFGVARRASTHNLDLNGWFTQPCVIIIGHMGLNKKVESPVPLLVDGRQAPTEGRTVVRWIYPLAGNPPTVNPSAKDEDLAAPGPNPNPG